MFRPGFHRPPRGCQFLAVARVWRTFTVKVVLWLGFGVQLCFSSDKAFVKVKLWPERNDGLRQASGSDVNLAKQGPVKIIARVRGIQGFTDNKRQAEF